MRDLVYIIAPLAPIIFFLVYPDQFRHLLTWASTVLH
jgi:hypothetical protein